MIKTFLLRCFIFALAAFGCLCGVNAVLNTVRPRLFDMSGKHIAFFGNSHIETSVDDTIVSEAVNFARSSELPEYMFAKIKLLHKYNPGLDTVYVCLDNLMPYNQQITSELMSPAFYDCLSQADYAVILRHGSFDEITHHLAHPLDKAKLIDYIFAATNPAHNIRQSIRIGGYMYLERDKLAQAIARARDSGPIARADKDLNAVAVHFFDRIYQYCKTNGITLIFICAPQHPESPWDKTHYRHFAAGRYPDVPFLDFMNVSLPDSCFGDIDHLNHRGARIFSRFLEDSVIHRPVKSRTYSGHIK